ncbi:TPA: hypothetical protein OUI19_001711 [Pseudomonas aeruginosa]|uniref:hypothetical protein n=1 Tax=Pseudomonas monteilii TaxID=76759 RepID=UPI0022905AFD|nr:hypothetical protein [Pseudomonas monteilii]MDD2127152.1 hypothetical protein [Pseudomonas monteilii]HCU1997407.1 hypothetical protein [Pseudomonas aeruginosa]
MKIAIAKLDAALDKFWIGVVLHAYHRLMSAHYRRKAARLAQKVQGRTNEIQNPAYQVRAKDQFLSHRHQVLRHDLEAKLIRGETC